MSCLIFEDIDTAATPWRELPENSSRSSGAAPFLPPLEAALHDDDELTRGSVVSLAEPVRTSVCDARQNAAAGSFSSTQGD